MSADLQLLQAYARTRDAQALSALVSTYSDMVYGTCLRILKNVADAEDATQECFLRLARDSAKVHTSLGAWLHRCATNECISRVRSLSANHRRERAYEINRQEEKKESSWGEISDQVDKALEELPDELRAVLIGHFLERRTQTQLAAELGVSPATMSRRINEGVEAIRKKLARSGVIVSALVLGIMLLENTAHASPVTLLAGLGKMAIAGPGASSAAASTVGAAGTKTAASGVGTATSTSSSLLSGKLLLAYTGAAVFVIAAAGLLSWKLVRHPAHPGNAGPADATLLTSSADTAARDRAIAALSPQQRRIDELVYQLRMATPPDKPAQWVQTVKDLAAIGKPAVSTLAAELDNARRDGEQRLLILTLRNIGDARAVPSLIRALPRVSPAIQASELPTSDPATRDFLAKNTIAHSSAEYWGFSTLDAGITQCTAALESLTRHSEGRDAITNGARSDDPAEVARDQDLRTDLADRWAQWWKLHYKDLVSEKDLASLDAARTDLIDPVGRAAFGPVFPAGLRPGPLHEATLQAAGTWDAPAYIDLDNDKILQHNEGWHNIGTLDVEKGDWIAQAGVDAYARLTRPLDRNAPSRIPMLQSRGLTAWPVPNQRFDRIDAELAQDKPLDLGAQGPTERLLPTDEKTGAPLYNAYPATFLFATREGGRGILQITGPANNNSALHLRYRMLQGTTVQQPPLAIALAQPDQTPAPASFGEVHDVTLASPLARDDSALDLHTGKTMPQQIDDDVMLTAAKRQWLETWGGDLLTLTWPNRQLCGLGGDQMLALEVSPNAWDNLSPQLAQSILARRDPSAANAAGAFLIPDPTHPLPATWLLQTRTGESALLQITELSPDHLTLRYKLIAEK
ncbi:MAG: RNA polymerase sigma factor [Phycisphaerae bacterium]